MKVLRRSFGPWMTVMHGHRRRFVFTLAIAVLAGLLEVFGLATLVPLLSGGSALPTVAVVGFFAVAIVAAVIFRFVADRSGMKLSTQIEKELRLQILNDFWGTRWALVAALKHGEISTRLLSTTSQIANGAQSLVVALTNLAVGLVLVVGAVALDPLLSLLLVLYVPCAVILYRSAARRMTAIQAQLLETNMVISEESSTILQNTKQLYTSSGREEWRTRLSDIIEQLRFNRLLELTVSPILRRDMELVGAGFIVIAISASAFRGNLAAAIVFLAIFYRLLPRMQAYQSSMAQARGQEVWLKDWDEFRSQITPARGDDDDVAFVQEESSDGVLVDFGGVSFAYQGAGTKALNDVHLRIRRGDRIALVGETGSGKTTLLDAVAGLHVPQSGTLTFFGAACLDDWRRTYAYATQDPMLRSGSLRENLVWMVGDVDEAWLRRILDACQLNDFVSELPDGLETQINLKASTVSGGQKQRLALARTLIARPRLLLLDEATSALDVATERKVMSAIFDLPGLETIVAISHRPEMANLFPRRVTLRKGVVTDSVFPDPDQVPIA